MRFCPLFFALLFNVCAFAVERPPAFQALPRSSVLIVVDGAKLTKDDALRQAKTFMALAMNKGRRTHVGKSERRIFRSLCQTADVRFRDRIMLRRYATERGIRASTNLVSSVTRQIERQYGVRSKKLNRWHNLDDLKYMLGRNAAILDDEVRARADYIAVTNHILTTHPPVVTDEAITNRLQFIRVLNNRAASTNALVYARATNVWQKIVGKELTFEQAATNFSEDVYLDMGCEWGSFGLDQLADDPAVLEVLPKLKVGDITAPLPSDCGLAILRLDDIEDDKTYTFSRVFFRLPVFYETETSEQARETLLVAETKKIIERELEAVRRKMKIEYPSGTNLFDKACAPLAITKEDLAD